jgi:hypothetical protein
MVCMGVGNALCSQSPMLEARSFVMCLKRL